MSNYDNGAAVYWFTNMKANVESKCRKLLTNNTANMLRVSKKIQS